MSQDRKHFIYQKIEEGWKESGAWPEFIEAMRLALPANTGGFNPERDPASWTLLPGLCCQAAGGDPSWADDISAAWLLLYTAAHVFDSIEDQDQPDSWMEGLGTGEVINIASGLIFSASYILSRFLQTEKLGSAAGEIGSQFYRSVLRMSSGQHLDLVNTAQGLETWFKIAEAKSGTFFSLACWSGARLATGDRELLDGYARFGSHLGLLLQIHDDWHDLRRLKEMDEELDIKGITRSLPFAYALEVLPEQVREDLLKRLDKASGKEEANQEVFSLLEGCGAPLYLKVESERHLGEARSALEAARPEPAIAEQIQSFLRVFKES